MTARTLPTRGDPLIRRLELTDDLALGAALLADAPTNAGYDDATLERFARAAAQYGAALVDAPRTADPIEVVERTGGLGESPLIARYRSADHSVELFSDSVDLCEAVIEHAGWRGLFPSGTVRAAAVEHERAHHLITADRSAGLRRALGHPVLRIGPYRRWGFVAAADEVAAHAFAARVLGLPRSPLLFTAAVVAALTPVTTP